MYKKIFIILFFAINLIINMTFAADDKKISVSKISNVQALRCLAVSFMYARVDTSSAEMWNGYAASWNSVLKSKLGDGAADYVSANVKSATSGLENVTNLIPEHLNCLKIVGNLNDSDHKKFFAN